MTFKIDIIDKIKVDFGGNSTEAFEKLEKAIQEVDYLQTDRIIRCIIFLSKGNLTQLDKYIEAAIFDPRDVMFWAEYENHDDFEKTKRLRDFNNVFEQSAIKVKE
jgi:hypothetical protein